MSAGYAEAVTSWAHHLRDGGTTAWSAWQPDAHPGPLAGPLPSAVHLELLRRLNGAGAAPGLADVVLSTPVPGRGGVDVRLPWPAAARAWGHPATDPAGVPAEDLVRLAVGVLSRLLPDTPAADPPPDLARWPLPWRRRFRLHGSPGTVAAVREALYAQGLAETDWRPVHLVLARPVPVMMAERWASGVARGDVQRWGTVWDRVETRGRLPARLDVARTADRLATASGGRGRVHLVLARDDTETADLVARILGIRPLELHTGTDPARIDLLRRLNRHTGVAHGPTSVRRLAERLADVLGRDRPTVGVPLPAPPAAHLAFARACAADLAALLRTDQEDAGYAVHGDPAVLAPAGDEAGGVDPRRTLEEAVWGCREVWRRREGAP